MVTITRGNLGIATTLFVYSRSLRGATGASVLASLACWLRKRPIEWKRWRGILRPTVWFPGALAPFRILLSPHPPGTYTGWD